MINMTPIATARDAIPPHHVLTTPVVRPGRITAWPPAGPLRVE